MKKQRGVGDVLLLGIIVVLISYFNAKISMSTAGTNDSNHDSGQYTTETEDIAP
jgi:hypothetical protein